MRKILLTGATGQLGREWQIYFNKRGDDNLLIIPYESHQLDITQPEQLGHEIHKQQPDMIINCAAYTNVDGAETEREQAQRANVDAVENLARLCRRFDIKLVHFSTDFIFAGNKEDRQRFPAGYPEDHPAAPVNWYGQTKWEGEQAIRRLGCRHLIMRVSWLCGAHGQNFVTTMLRLAREEKELSVVDDQIGSPTFADKLVQNTARLLEDDRQGTYHYTTEGKLSWAEFAEAIFDMTDQKIQVDRVRSKDYPTTAARPFFSKLSSDKIKQIDGIETENWQIGLERLIEKLD